jgi:NAD(P)-dependent dehydrogenase (short-subunit alcohol dehydrogenase family)
LTTDVDYKGKVAKMNLRFKVVTDFFEGVVYGTQLAIHFMRKNKVPGGKIVATASAAGLYPHESYPEYNGAKAGVSYQ